MPQQPATLTEGKGGVMSSFRVDEEQCNGPHVWCMNEVSLVLYSMVSRSKRTIGPAPQAVTKNSEVEQNTGCRQRV